MARAAPVIFVTLAAALLGAPADGHGKASKADPPKADRAGPDRPARRAAKAGSAKAEEKSRDGASVQHRAQPSLVGLTPAEAKAKLGPPDAAREEGAGAMWTYRLDDCALFVFFKAGDDHPLKVSGTASGARRRGEAAPPVQACLAEALKR